MIKVVVTLLGSAYSSPGRVVSIFHREGEVCARTENQLSSPGRRARRPEIIDDDVMTGCTQSGSWLMNWPTAGGRREVGQIVTSDDR